MRLSPVTAAAAALALAALFPLVAPSDYFVYVMTLAYIAAISATGLNLIVGYAGQLNLAHAGFFAIGAYALGILTVDHGVPFWPAFLLAGAAAALAGLLAGLVALRLKADSFAIFTLCIGIIIALVIEKSDSLTHGVVGLVGIPAPGAIGPLRFATPLAQYYLVLAFLVVALLAMHRITRSLLGRAFVAIRNDEDLAASLGVNVMRTKLLAFVLSTIYAGLAGALFAGLIRVIGPPIALESRTFELLTFILVGGAGTLFGPVLGAIVLTWIAQSLQFLQDYSMLVFGPMLILLIMFMPSGVMGLRGAKRSGA